MEEKVKKHRGRSREECIEMNKDYRFTSETARIAGLKSAQARANRRTIAKWIEQCSTDEDMKEIAMGMIARAKKSTMAATALRDTIGEKPSDNVQVTAEIVTVTADEKAEERRKYAESLKENWKP